MREELQAFENRSDDWLAKERAYEESVSAWDFDDGKKIKLEHHKDCDAEEIKESHHSRHIEYNKTHPKGLIDDSSQFEDINKISLVRIIIPMLAMFTLMMITIIANAAGVIEFEEAGMFMPIIIFIIGMSLISKKKKEK